MNFKSLMLNECKFIDVTNKTNEALYIVNAV